MKLAVSNIAWPADQDAAVAALFGELGVSGLEVAPTKVWPRPLEATDAQLDAYRGFWESRGIRIIAAQSLLFGRPDFSLFESIEGRERTLEYLCRMVRLCTRLGAEALVFGSPKNRRVNDHPVEVIRPAAVDFFSRLGEAAAAAGTAVVLEANPPEYGADYIVRAAEAVELVRAVNHPGFRLHLDTACMTLAGDDPAVLIESVLPLLRHFHVSEPHLAPVSTGAVRHEAFASQLRRLRYPHWVSIEMREGAPSAIEAVRSAVRFTRDTYGPDDGPPGGAEE
jgi:D-psicose/D-tagatose/L-ribulose 3-epimerase